MNIKTLKNRINKNKNIHFSIFQNIIKILYLDALVKLSIGHTI